MLPEDISNRSFDGALHGYDKSQVRDFLAQVATEHEAVVARVEEAEANLGAVQSRLESLDELVRTSGERCRAAEDRIAELEGVQARLSELEGAEARVAELEDVWAAELESSRARTAELDEARSRIVELESELQEALLSARGRPEDAARQLGDEVTAVLQSAVSAGQAMRSEAESWAEQLRRDVNKEVSEYLDAARAEVSDLVGRGEERLEQLRASETTLRAWLREAQTTIGDLLNEPQPDLPVIELTDPPSLESEEWAEDLPVDTY